MIGYAVFEHFPHDVIKLVPLQATNRVTLVGLIPQPINVVEQRRFLFQTAIGFTDGAVVLTQVRFDVPTVEYGPPEEDRHSSRRSDECCPFRYAETLAFGLVVVDWCLLVPWKGAHKAGSQGYGALAAGDARLWRSDLDPCQFELPPALGDGGFDVRELRIWAKNDMMGKYFFTEGDWTGPGGEIFEGQVEGGLVP